jgi:hypothetical protein
MKKPKYNITESGNDITIRVDYMVLYKNYMEQMTDMLPEYPHKQLKSMLLTKPHLDLDIFNLLTGDKKGLVEMFRQADTLVLFPDDNMADKVFDNGNMDTNITIVIIYPDKEIIIENKDISV